MIQIEYVLENELKVCSNKVKVLLHASTGLLEDRVDDLVLAPHRVTSQQLGLPCTMREISMHHRLEHPVHLHVFA